MKKNNILISGTSTGLGKFLVKKFNAISFNRKNRISKYQNRNWSLIIHCGFYNGESIQKTINCIKLSYELSVLKSKKRIFISSSLIYKKKDKSLYTQSKRICELFFKKKNDYIIRLGSIIGKEMRENSIYKIIFKAKPKITLTQNSINSFVSYDEVFELIKLFIKQDKIKCTDFYRTDFKKIGSIAKKLGKKVQYGSYHFNCAKNIKTKKIDFYKLIKKKNSIDIIKSLANR